MELDLVQDLRGVAAHEVQKAGCAFDGVLVGTRKVETARQPLGLVRQMLQEHRPALRDGVVAEPLLLHRKVARRMGEMLGVSAFVEECAPVVGAADRLDDEHDAVGHLDRRAKGAWALVWPLLEVERHVLLRAQVDPQILEGALERRDHLVGREHRIPLGGAEETRHVPTLCLGERDADAGAEKLVGPVLVELFRRVEERAALHREVVQCRGRQRLPVQLEVVVELEVARSALHRLGSVQMERVHVLVEKIVRALVEHATLVSVRFVRKGRADHPVRNLLAVHRHSELRFQLGELFGVITGELAEIALAGEPPKLPYACPPVHGQADGLDLVELGQVLVALVDRRQVKSFL